MSSWTTSADIRAETERLWRQGHLLVALLQRMLAIDAPDAPPQSAEPSNTSAARTPGISFPYPLRLRAPRPSELGTSFEEAQAWVHALERASRRHTGTGFDIEWQEVNTRALGRNRLPTALILPSLKDALALIGKQADADRFLECAQVALSRWPALADWIGRRSLTVLEHAADWPLILDVVGWMVANPRSGLFARQIDVAGADTKFVESRKALLSELLDALLPAEAIDRSATGVHRFEARYGLAIKPVTIRFRLLDTTLAVSGLTDLTVPVAEFAGMDVRATRVFIVENEVTFLSFPRLPGGLLVFGSGYGIDRLAPARWLASRVITYWGDIDTHGFSILDRLRALFPGTRSLLMDRATLLSHRAQWSVEAAPHTGELYRLNAEERTLYDDLRRDRMGSGVRLEQERVGFGYARPVILSASS
ncbi:MAG: Wadjet anti-phage system protein JetD domain-containing protein [Hyphomicrobiaceae bacterium]